MLDFDIESLRHEEILVGQLPPVDQHELADLVAEELDRQGERCLGHCPETEKHATSLHSQGEAMGDTQSFAGISRSRSVLWVALAGYDIDNR